ncbi:MAG: SpoIID/LytB domain-containing protein [Armatimonadota bacterium]
MLLRLKWFLPALLVFVAGQPERCLGEPPKVRIGLLRGVQAVAFAAPAGAVSVHSLGGSQAIAEVPPGASWQATAEGQAVRLSGPDGAGVASDAGVLLIPPENGVVRISAVPGHWDGIMDRDYRGMVEIRGVGGTLRVVNLVDIETYLRGVVPSEMPAKYPLAALEAQAVAARGQALAKAGRHETEGFDLCATQHCQVYGGATTERPETDRAVAETWGQVLEYEGRLANTLYSSNCGGHTADNEDYWPSTSPVAYLRGTADYDPASVSLVFPLAREALKQYLKYAPPVYCNQPRYANTAKFRWWSVVPREELRTALVAEVGEFGELLDVRITGRAESGIAREVAVIGSKRLFKIRGGSEIRRALGGLNSASFAIEALREGDDPPLAFLIWGAGWGHQVGMCQVGAAGMADLGWDYRAILAKYYQGCTVTNRY